MSGACPLGLACDSTVAGTHRQYECILLGEMGCWICVAAQCGYTGGLLSHIGLPPRKGKQGSSGRFQARLS
eukprot:5454966-Prymnesium_polylepis.1